MAVFTSAMNYSQPHQMFTYANAVTDGWFGIVTLLAMFIIIFASLKKYESSQAFAASAFITTLISMMYYAIGIVDTKIVVLFMIATGISAMFLWHQD
jgi:uncharacterized membrane protein YfcA